MGLCRRLFSTLFCMSPSLPTPDLTYRSSREFEKVQAKRAVSRNERDAVNERQKQLKALPERDRCRRQKSIEELSAKRQKVKPKKSVSHGRRVEMQSVGGTILVVDRSSESQPHQKCKSPSRKARAGPEPILISDVGKTPEDVQKLHERVKARLGDDFKPPTIVPHLPGRPSRQHKPMRRTLRK